MNTELRRAIAQADVIVVGSGLFGCTVAERASSVGLNVVVIERRHHTGGNAYSYFDQETEIEVHQYGSHLFHTSNRKVWEYVNRFTSFNGYHHSVWTVHDGNVFSMPINLGTICHFYGRNLSPTQARELLESESSAQGKSPTSLEEKAIASVGRPLYEALIRGYTSKQWETDPRDLPPGVITRLPVRFNFDNRYFADRWEGLPADGYEAWINRMLASEKITTFLGIDFFAIKDNIAKDKPIVFTGPIDKYFGYRWGPLGWRTLDFEFDTVESDDFQGTAVMNYADIDVAYTRIHEFKHLHPERRYPKGKTVIAKEYSRFASEGDEPYYPLNTEHDRMLLARYRQAADGERNVFFGGRLGSYQYLDMHMAIASALSLWENSLWPHLAR